MLHLEFVDDPGRLGTNEDGHPGKLLGVREIEGGLEISVFTNGARSQGYRSVIPSRDFETLAKEMVKANPEVAVKAFGAAMQDAKFPPKPSRAPGIQS
jgi:hypothetical protein